MATLLVTVRKARWYTSNLPSFLGRDDIPADCLADLKTQQNEMSVWRIENDESNLRRVLTALAANRDDSDHMDYIQFDESILSELGIKFSKTAGGTPDKHANRLWHYDLVELSGARLLALASAIFRDSKKGRLLNKEVLGMLKASVASQEVDLSKVSSKLRVRLQTVPMAPISRFFRMCRRLGSEMKDAWREFRNG